MRSSNLVIAGALVAVLLCASCAKKTVADPKDAFHSFQSALSDKDFAAVWDMLSGSSQKQFEQHFFDETRKDTLTMNREHGSWKVNL